MKDKNSEEPSGQGLDKDGEIWVRVFHSGHIITDVYNATSALVVSVSA